MESLKLSIYIFSLFVSINCLAQVEVVPIYRDPAPLKQNKNKSARTSARLTPQDLPFWDDFSFNNSKYYPNNTLWENSNSVWVNSGTGIKPPSINVATFDGYDPLGKPYSIDLLAKGFRDTLTSRALRLDDVPKALQPAVFISFFYQFKGNGDAPESGDNLLLFFKNRKGQWIKAWSTEQETNFTPDKFVQRKISISDTSFFHNDFQFRFQNFGRLSGPYDTWNLDYIYVNNGKAQYAPALKDFPDRTVSGPLTSLLGIYTSAPVKHFFSDTTANELSRPALVFTNRREDQGGEASQTGSPTNFTSTATIFTKKTGSSIQALEAVGKAASLRYNVDSTKYLEILPKLNLYASENDSLSIVLDVKIGSSDNEKKRKVIARDSNGNPKLDSLGNVLLIDKGDYDSIVYQGIDFRLNDVVKSTTILSNYYAYDDGTAEYGLNIDGRGTQLAYQYDLLTNARDTIIRIDVYFPRFGDNTSQTVQLFVMDTLTGNASDFVYKQSIGVSRNARDVFYRADIPAGAAVKGRFYIGWEMNSDAVIPVGLDRNTDSGDKIFIRTLDTGIWEKNLTLKGSLMIRPVFGNTKEKVITGVEDTKATKPYPNPTQQSFFLSADAQQIQLYDIAGKQIVFEQNDQFDKKEIKITNPTTGLYLVRYFDKKWRTEKIMVLP